MVPARVALIGIMGSGKTTVGRKLARLLDYDFIDMDRELVRLAGLSVSRQFREQGEARFREREALLLRRLARRRRVVVSTGGGVVLKASNRRTLGARFVTIWLKVGVAEAWRRLGTARNRPLLAGDDPRRALEVLVRLRNPLYARTGLPVITAGRTPEAIARLISRRLMNA